MKLHALITKLQVLVLNDPTAADREVLAECETEEAGKAYALISGEHRFSDELFWDRNLGRNVTRPAIMLTGKDDF